MGAFYGSIQIRSDDRDAVKAAVESVAQECKRKFLLGPVLKGWIAVYPDGSGQDDACAKAIAKRFNSIILQLVVHDDDIFIYNFFRNGELLNEYSSRPDYFGEISLADRERLKPKPELFRELVDSPERLAKLSQLLGAAEEFTIEQQRLEEFADLLGIENSLTSYEYLVDGEREGIKNWKQFSYIPDQTAEKTAKKEAEAALRRKKQEWQKAGLLCNEWLPPCNKRYGLSSTADICSDPRNGGFVVLWHRMAFGNPAQLHCLQPPWNSKPPVIDISFSPPHFHNLTISPSGNWLAYFDGRLRLWDWRERRLVQGIQLEASPVTFSQDERLILCRSKQEYTLFSLQTRQIVRTFQLETPITGVQALHSSDSFLITRHRQDQLGIINLESGKLDKVLFCGAIMDESDLASNFAPALKQAGVPERRINEWKLAFIRGSWDILNLRFSSDGSLLFCATTNGLQVLAWSKVLAATRSTPEPLHIVLPVSDAADIGYHTYGNYVYDVTLDETQSRVLFSGIEGTIRFLNLSDGSTGILVDPPGKSPMWKLELSHDKKFICCLCCPSHEERNKKPPRVQVWNYTALCKAAGLE